MDLIINIDEINNKLTNFKNQKNNVDNINNKFNSSYINKLNGTEISNATSKIKTSVERLKKGYNNSHTWFSNYIKEVTETESNLTSCNTANISEPIEFKGKFTDIFTKDTIPVLQTNGNKNLNYDRFNIKVTGDNKINGNVIDVSTPVYVGTKYELSEEDYAYLGWIAKKEQGSIEGAKLELSLMANLFETKGKKYNSITNYVRNSGWFSNSKSYKYPGEEYIKAAKEVIRDGNRYLTSNIVEHDWTGDISSISTGSVNKRSDYIPGKTVIHNKMGATYIFLGFAPNDGDPFGYFA